MIDALAVIGLIAGSFAATNVDNLRLGGSRWLTPHEIHVGVFNRDTLGIVRGPTEVDPR